MLAVHTPPAWPRQSVAWAKGRGLDQVAVEAIETDLARFRRLREENREREAARAADYEAHWAEHGKAWELTCTGLRGLPVPHEFIES